MMKVIKNLYRLTLINFCGLALLLTLQMPTHAQQGSYSNAAQNILDRENTQNAEGAIEADIFKFSINEILNSAGVPLKNANGDPEIFGRTDYGSEFVLANDLSTTSEIQIPAFVINVLAEDENGEYLPVIVNGFSDEEDGNYIRSYTNDELNAHVEETFNSNGPNVFSFEYENRTEIQYLPDEGVTVTKNLYTDGGHSKNYVEDDVRVYTETNSNGYSFTNYHDDGRENPIFAIDYNYEDGSTAFEINENGERYFQRTYSDNTSEFRYSEDKLEIGQNIQANGNAIKFVTKTDAVGNTETIRQLVIPDGAITLEYETNLEGVATYVRNNPVTNEDGTVSYAYSGSENHKIEEIVTENGDSSFYIDEVTFIENVGEVVSITDRVASKDALTQQLQVLVEEGEETISLSKNFDNSNSRPIDFKDVYDEVNGQSITPEMGYVRIVGDEENQYINLSTGDVIEFFVRPTNSYLENHGNNSELFFLDRPIAKNPVVVETGAKSENTYDIGPGEEAITLPNGEIKVYVTTVYVQAPASKFLPSQVVMPVKSDGDFNYDVEPAAAETFPDEIQVVAIPEKKAQEISEKVKQIKKEKEAPSNPKHDEDGPPPLDPGIEAMLKLNIFLNDVQKGPSKLLAETKKTIQKEFPNMSNELITLIISIANTDEKFDLIKDPKDFLDKEFSKSNNLLDLNSLLSTNLSRKELIKIYNLIVYKFSADLAELGFGTLKNQKFNFSNNVYDPDQILDQVQLQNDIMAIVSLLGLENDNQTLSNLLIEPVNVDPESSTALFQSNQSQKLLSQIKVFSKVINSINNLPRTTIETKGILDSDIPLIELNVRFGQNIAEALKEKLAEDKRLNSAFQPRSQSSKLEKFNFELPSQDQSSTPPASPPLLAEPPNITDQELQLITETTEATNNILDGTIDKMLSELEDTLPDGNTLEIISTTNNLDFLDQENDETKQNVVFSNALSSVQRLEEIEDIRAIFEILGIGS